MHEYHDCRLFKDRVILARMNREILPFVAAALLDGCKIIQSSTSGGSIMSASGNYDCAEGSTCEIDVPNGERFAETFNELNRARQATHAVPRSSASQSVNRTYQAPVWATHEAPPKQRLSRPEP